MEEVQTLAQPSHKDTLRLLLVNSSTDVARKRAD